MRLNATAIFFLLLLSTSAFAANTLYKITVDDVVKAAEQLLAGVNR